MALPFNLMGNTAILQAVNRISVFDRIIVLQNIGSQVICVPNDLILVQVMKVILQVRQKKRTHAQGINQHVVSALDSEKPHIDPKLNETVDTVEAVMTNIVG